ncbi:MAG: hypothetical protein E4G90_11765, partial [Gemmatimonadales bacterium]
MLIGSDLDLLAVSLDEDPSLHCLLDRIRVRAAPLRDDTLGPPHLKALLSRDGGICPDDGKPLHFDPLHPREHHCRHCNRIVTGDRHDRHWARAAHLWFAERTADLALLGSLSGDLAAA